MSCPRVYLRQHLPDKHKQMEAHPLVDTAFGHLLQNHELQRQQVLLPEERQSSTIGSADLLQGPKIPALMAGLETPRARRRARHAPS